MRDDSTSPKFFGRIVREAWEPTRAWAVFALLGVVTLAIYLPGLGLPELKGEEERRILPGIEMLRTGDWVQPMIGGEPYHTKPPMINWIVAGSFLATGQINEWTARLPSLAGMLLFLGVLAFYPCRHLSLRARLVAGLIFLTNIGLFEKGRLIEIEALLISLTGAGALWWFLARWNGDNGWRLWLVPSALLAVGLLLKGPPVVIFFYGLVGCVLLAERRLRDLFTPIHIVSAAFALGCFVLWYAMSAKQTSHSDVSFNLVHEATARFLNPLGGWSNWARIAVLSFANFLPWVCFVPMLWSKRWTEGLDERSRRLLIGARWSIVLTFLPLALLPGTSARYSMPVFPMLSVLLGLAFVRLQPSRAEARFGKVALLAGVTLLCLAQLVGWWIVAPTVVAALAVLGSLAIAGWIWRERSALDERQGRVWGTTGVVVAAALGYSVFVTPLLARRERFRPAGAAISAHVPAGETIHIYKPGPQEFVFYVERPIGYVLEPTEVTDDVTYLAIRRTDLETVAAHGALAGRGIEEVHAFNARLEGEFRLVRLTPTRVAADVSPSDDSSQQ